jgi:hypothetical protein
MPPTPLSVVYCTKTDMDLLLSREGIDLRKDDDEDAFDNSLEADIVPRAINYATSRVNLYCLGFYDAIQLETSWLVNEWTTIVAVRWMCGRRGNPVPTSLAEMFKEALADLELVRSGVFQIPDIGKRFPDSPAWANVTFDGRYRYARTRIEQSISENSPSQQPQQIDHGSAFSEY